MAIGDTQPMSSQVYRDYLRKRKDNEQAGEDAYLEGDTGHVNLGVPFEDNGLNMPSTFGEQHTIHDPHAQGLEIGNHSPGNPTQDRGITDGQPAVSSPGSTSITPFAGKKHDRYGNIIEGPQFRTPKADLSVMFHGNKEPLEARMTQLFENTQADSSSPNSPRNLRSDPVFARPSPELRSKIQSTPAHPTSSPPTTRKPGFRLSFAPRDIYRSLDESQVQRYGDQQPSSNTSSPMPSEDEPMGSDEEDSHQKEYEQGKKRQMILTNARKDFQSLSTTTVSKGNTSSSFLRAKTSYGLTTPQQAFKRPFRDNEIITISSDVKPKTVATARDQSPVDQYDELSQAIIQTSPRSPQDRFDVDVDLDVHDEDQHAAAEAVCSPSAEGTHNTDVLLDYNDEDINENQVNTPERDSPKNLDGNANERAIVENSQFEGEISLLKQPLRMVLPSSETSRGFVSQSQLVSVSSYGPVGRPNKENDQEDQPLDTSSLPPAPHSSTSSPGAEDEEAGGETPASSPPRAPSVSTRFRQASHISAGGYKGLENQPRPLSIASQPNPIINKEFFASDQSKENRPPTADGQERRNFRTEISILETSPVAVASNDTNCLQRSSAPPKVPPAPPASVKTSLFDSKDSKSGRSSGLTNAFQTAPSRQSTSSSGKASVKIGQPALVTTPKATPQHVVRSMLDIANERSPSTPSKRMDINELSLLSEDDAGYYAAISRISPGFASQKRHTISSKKEQDVSAQHIDASPSRLTPAKENLPAYTGMTADQRQIDVVHEVQDQHTSQSSERSELDTAPILHGIVEDLRTNTTFADVRTGQEEDATVTRVSQGHIVPSGRVSLPANPADAPTALSANITHPKRVIAMFKGLSPSFYPATLIGPSKGSKTAFDVCFDDGAVGSVERHLIKTMDLRRGDLVKLDQPAKRNTIFVIHDLEREALNDHDEKDLCDARGFEKVTLEPKQRTSLPAQSSERERVRITTNVTYLYWTTPLYERLKDRELHVANDLRDGNAVRTPTEPRGTPSTPSSRTRNKGSVHSFSGMPPKALEVKPPGENGSIFSNVTLCISLSNERAGERPQLIRHIEDQGGDVLHNGFEELFETADTPLKSHFLKSQDGPAATSSLHLSKAAHNVGFIAVISDGYSRRTKYMQALALNIPCLHQRWVTDSVAKGCLQPWKAYLLPSGQSSQLDGAIKSREMMGLNDVFQGEITTLKLDSLFSARRKIFENKRVLLVIGGGKIGERRAAYTFLTRVAGAATTLRVKDLPTARAALSDGSRWDLLVVEDSRVKETKIKLAAQLGGKSGSSEVKNRPRAKTATKSVSAATRIVGDETIVQSLISGSWIDGQDA